MRDRCTLSVIDCGGPENLSIKKILDVIIGRQFVLKMLPGRGRRMLNEWWSGGAVCERGERITLKTKERELDRYGRTWCGGDMSARSVKAH